MNLSGSSHWESLALTMPRCYQVVYKRSNNSSRQAKCGQKKSISSNSWRRMRNTSTVLQGTAGLIVVYAYPGGVPT